MLCPVPRNRMGQVFLRALRKSWRDAVSLRRRLPGRMPGPEETLYEARVQYRDQDANDLIRRLLQGGEPLLVAKFGTVELAALANVQSQARSSYTFGEVLEFIRSERSGLWWSEGIEPLCLNAGFFPRDEALLGRFHREYMDALPQIDVLGSYIRCEAEFEEDLKGAVRVNLDGYYAPFFHARPWTEMLAGKKVLIVHPFVESIARQLRHRQELWSDPAVLPEFDARYVKAVQTIAGEIPEFETWFDALQSMKDAMDQEDYDIALVGCGAYGLPLAAHAKARGKQAIHLAGWLQVLFGIKGKRWLDDPRMRPFINDAWVHPLPSEVPGNFRKVENGCYW